MVFKSMEEKLITRVEAAKFLGLSYEALKAWASKQAQNQNNRPRLPFVKLGRSVRYRVKDLIEFVEANTRGGGLNA